MGIWISRISVKNWGPLTSFDREFSPGKVYLFYGPNETGKTFLVDFLLHTLFGERDLFSEVRDGSGSGRVFLEVDAKRKEFRGTQKWEKIVEKEKRDPRLKDLLKVLIVRGGEVKIGKERGYLSEKVLYDLFSRRRILDEIGKGIRETIKSVTWEEGELWFDRKGKLPGEVERWMEGKKKILHIQEKLGDLILSYDPVGLKDLEEEIRRVMEEREKIRKAKRYRIYEIVTTIEKLEREIQSLPDEESLKEAKQLLEERKGVEKEIGRCREELKKRKEEREKGLKSKEEFEKVKRALQNAGFRLEKKLESLKGEKAWKEEIWKELEKKIGQYEREKGKWEEIKKEGESLKKEVSYIPWLSELEKEYDRLFKPSFGGTLLVATVCFLLSPLVPYLFPERSFLTLPLSFLLLLSGFFFGWRFYRSLPYRKEREEVQKEFQKMFGENLVSKVQIQGKLNELRLREERLKALSLERKEEEYRTLFKEIATLFQKVCGREVKEEEWERERKVLEEEVKRREEELRQIEGDIRVLRQYEEHFFPSEEETLFDLSRDCKRYEELRRKVEELKRVEEEIQEWERKEEEFVSEKKEIQEKIDQFLTKWGKEQEGSPEEVLEKIGKVLERKRKELGELEGELKGLGGRREEIPFPPENPGIRYDPDQEKELENLLEEKRKVQDSRKEEDSRRKHELLTVAGLDPSFISLSLLEIWGLVEGKRKEEEENLRDLLSEIVAQKILSDVVEEEKRREKEILSEVLSDEEFRSLLKEVTEGRYEEIEMDQEEEGKGEISVVGREGSYPLNDLSTGARERVLLALRVGIGRKVLGTDTAFLILDDAFQHVDWEKRPSIVRSLLALAKRGWQIFFFTMDDHFRDLFEKEVARGEPVERVENFP